MNAPLEQFTQAGRTGAELRIRQEHLAPEAAVQLRRAASAIRRLQEEVSYWKGMCEKASIIMSQQQTINEERLNHAQYASRAAAEHAAEHEPDPGNDTRLTEGAALRRAAPFPL